MIGEFLLYQAPDGSSRIQVRLEDRTLWFTQQQLADLCESAPQNITQHIRAIYTESELIEAATCKPYLQVRAEAGRQVSRPSSNTTWMWSSPLANECARTVIWQSGRARGSDFRVTRIVGGVRARLQLPRTHTHGPVGAAPSRAGNCCDAVATFELAACACTAADQGPPGARLLRRDVPVGTVGRAIERYEQDDN